MWIGHGKSVLCKEASPLYYASLLGLDWVLHDMIAIALRDSKLHSGYCQCSRWKL